MRTMLVLALFASGCCPQLPSDLEMEKTRREELISHQLYTDPSIVEDGMACVVTVDVVVRAFARSPDVQIDWKILNPRDLLPDGGSKPTDQGNLNQFSSYDYARREAVYGQMDGSTSGQVVIIGRTYSDYPTAFEVEFQQSMLDPTDSEGKERLYGVNQVNTFCMNQ